jgi:hypothetical protein
MCLKKVQLRTFPSLPLVSSLCMPLVHETDDRCRNVVCSLTRNRTSSHSCMCTITG